MIFDHLSLKVGDFAKSRAFFAEALRPLDIEAIVDGDGFVGFGRDGKPQLFLSAGDAQKPLHLAFSTLTREAVRGFHRAALAAGGQDHGAPGLRPQYHPHYYAAFVIGPDGHNIEAVSHAPTD